MHHADIFGGHRRAGGGFQSPWGDDLKRPGGRDFFRWRMQRWREGIPPNPPPGAFRIGEPRIAYPGASAGEMRFTWVGHATVLAQLSGTNLLIDPVWSRRVSPIPWAGPTRLVPAAVDFDALPDIHCVLLSHDHYDHLDTPTVRRLQRRFGDALTWVAPLGYRDWFAALGIRRVVELDWWEEALVPAGAAPLRVRGLPARHWTARNPWRPKPRLWNAFSLESAAGERVFYGGDSGYFPEYVTIGKRCGPFDAVILPIGAYEPRWFMKPVHMSPEETVQTYVDLGGQGTLIPVHWGTFRLSDESPLEPPVRLEAEWARRGLAPASLARLDHGATAIIPGAAPAGQIVTS